LWAQGANLAAKPSGEGRVLAQLGGEKLESPLLFHELMLGQIDGAHAALAQFADDPVGSMNDHARFQFANLAQHAAVGGAAGQLIVIAGFAMWAELHTQAGAGAPVVRLCHCDSASQLSPA
jgi:hypothetical protein